MVRAVSAHGVVGRCEPSSPSLNTKRNELHYRFLRIESPQCELFAHKAGNPRTGEDRDEGEMNSGATQHDDGAPKARHPSTGPGMTVPRLTFAEQLVLWSARRLSAAGLGAAATEPARAEDQPAQPVSAPPRARHRSLRPAAAPDALRACAARSLRSLHRPAHPRCLQFRLLRAHVPGAGDGRGAGAGQRPARPQRVRLYADHRHVRIAVGRDYADAAPTRGAVFGGGGSRLEVRVTVAESGEPEPAVAPRAERPFLSDAAPTPVVPPAGADQ